MGTRKAIVCAINNYGGAPNDLPSCINDARAFIELLDRNYRCRDIKTLFDREATAQNLEKALEWLVSDVTPDDRCALMFSGHGFTDLVDGIMKEFLVLVDEAGKPALWEDDKLVAITQRLPPGVFTAVLDCCFSGGLFKWVFDPTDATAEAAQLKVYQPPIEEQQKSFQLLAPTSQGTRGRHVTGYRRFGCIPTASTSLLTKAFGVDSSSSWGPTAAATKALSDVTEQAQPELNGLLISACLETETAAASTSRTKGLSAFTHSLLEVLARGTSERSALDVFNDTAANLKALGFRQTPMCLESKPGLLANRTFISLKEKTMAASEPVSSQNATGTAGQVSEPDMQKALFTVLAQALPVIISAVNGQRKALEMEQPAALSVDAPAGDSDGPHAEKFAALIASTVASTVAEHVLPRALDFAKERLGGGRPRPRHKAFAMEQAGASLDAFNDSDSQPDEKILDMIVSTTAATVAREVLPRALDFAKERLGGSRPRPRHKAVEIVPTDDTEIEKRLLPEIWRLATTNAPQIISMLQQHVAAGAGR
jgi:hypothetical protein